MYLTSTEYETIIGEDAPGEFETELKLAEGYFDLQTMSFFEQADRFASTPTLVKNKIKSLIAYSVLNIDQQGGVAGMIEPVEANSISIGKFSMSGLQGVPSSVQTPVSSVVLPFIKAYINQQWGVS